MRAAPSADGGPSRRANQKRRTRKDLLTAAARLMKDGRVPTLDEVAAEALVSRATAYRYFPGTEALLLEASLDVAMPEAMDLFPASGTDDPVARVERVDSALHDLVLANEAAFRLMLAQALQRPARPGADEDVPIRQNRRTPLIEAALAPARKEIPPRAFRLLVRALALIVGPEGLVAAKDVLQLTDAEARQVKRWAIRALIDAAAAHPSRT